MSFTKAMEFEETPVKPSKAKDVKLTAKNRAVGAMRELETPHIVLELVRRHWIHGLAIAYVVEQSLHFARFLGVIG